MLRSQCTSRLEMAMFSYEQRIEDRALWRRFIATARKGRRSTGPRAEVAPQGDERAQHQSFGDN